jgi:hypothetical protein
MLRRLDVHNKKLLLSNDTSVCWRQPYHHHTVLPVQQANDNIHGMIGNRVQGIVAIGNMFVVLCLHVCV